MGDGVIGVYGATVQLTVVEDDKTEQEIVITLLELAVVQIVLEMLMARTLDFKTAISKHVVLNVSKKFVTRISNFEITVYCLNMT